MKVGQSLKLENSVHGELGVLSPRTPGMARSVVQWAVCCVTEHLALSRVSVCGGEARIGSLMVMVQGPGAAEVLDIYSVQYLLYLHCHRGPRYLQCTISTLSTAGPQRPRGAGTRRRSRPGVRSVCTPACNWRCGVVISMISA